MKENEKTTARVCPKCGKTYTRYPALSRVDNETEICPDCGILEALESIGIGTEEREQILEAVHRSEERK